MESKFKTGDRVYHHPEGYGMVMGYQDGRVIVDPDDVFYTQKWLCEEEDLDHAATGAKSCHYYEEVTRNGRQWFRITPKGDWMPKREDDGQGYDRAMIAAMAMQGLLSSSSGKDNEDAAISVAKASVMYAEALIAELQRTEK
jgi:hypothetical protein